MLTTFFYVWDLVQDNLDRSENTAVMKRSNLVTVFGGWSLSPQQTEDILIRSQARAHAQVLL